MHPTLPPELLATPVEGLNLRPGTLADQLGDRPTLLSFLRHFGCPFCKQTVAELRKLSENPAYPPVIFFSQCPADETADFFADHWPAARAVADPDKRFYSAFELRRGTAGQIFGLRVWGCAVRSMTKGHFATKPVGDPWLMPGAFLVRGGEVLWCHTFRHQGDLPDWSKIPDHVPPGGAGAPAAASRT